MTKTICVADETAILGFLHRAGTAIRASGWQAPALSILDLHRADCSNPEHRADHPDLGALADEFYAPFVSEAVDGDTFASLRDALLVMLDADADGKVPFYFRTFAHLETENWGLEETPLEKLMPFSIYGIYMIREGDPTHYGEFLSNEFCYPPLPDDAPKNKHGQNKIEEYFDSNEGAEMGYTGEGLEGIEFATPAEMGASPFYSERYTFGADPGDLVFTDEVMEALAHVHRWDYERNAVDAIRENLAVEVTESAREYFQGNAVHPKGVLAAGRGGLDNVS